MATLRNILFATFAIVLLQENFVGAYRLYNGTFESPAGKVEQKIKNIFNTNNKELDLKKESTVKEETNHDPELETIEQKSSLLSDPTQRVRRSGAIKGEWIHTIKRGKRSLDFIPLKAAIDNVLNAAKQVSEQARRGKRSPDIFSSLPLKAAIDNAAKQVKEQARRGKRSPDIFSSLPLKAAIDNAAKQVREQARRGKRSPDIFSSLPLKAAIDNAAKQVREQAKRGKRSPTSSSDENTSSSDETTSLSDETTSPSDETTSLSDERNITTLRKRRSPNDRRRRI